MSNLFTKHLGLVLKTVERCNINCTYCYFFNKGDESYLDHPPYISLNTIEKIITFLKQGIKDFSLEKITIEFHGGEPLMQKKTTFDAMCSMFSKELASLVRIQFALQTNAMLVDEDWIKLFQKHKIGIGVSIDGPKKYHDKDRIDKKGKGTYDRVVEKINFMLTHPLMQKVGRVGALSVINPEFCGRKTYRFFVDEMRFKTVDFILPDFTQDDILPHKVETYGNFLCDLFNEWVRDDNPDINVRILNSTLDLFMGGKSRIYGVGPCSEGELPLISISSNGYLSPVDELRVCDKGSLMFNGAHISNTSLADYLTSEVFMKIRYAQKNLPSECQACCWKNICGGGALVNRYSKSKANDFNNPSIYCEGLKDFYAEVMTYLLNKGHHLNKMLEVMQVA